MRDRIPGASGEHRALTPGWQAYALFLSYPVAWALGLTWALWPIAGLMLVPAILRRDRIMVPSGFGLWILFLAWTLVSATQLDAPHRFAAFAYRSSLYLAATAVFLYILNAPPRALPTRSVLHAMALFWAVIALGGFLGIALPGVTLPALGAELLPKGWDDIGFVEQITSLNFSAASDFLGYVIPRPATFFAESNKWASNFAILVPIAIAMVYERRKGLTRTSLIVLLVASIVPFVFSLSRGAWISLIAALVYAGVVLQWRRGVRSIMPILVGAGLLALAFFASPLGDILQDRVETGHSDEHRALLATEAVGTTLTESPLFGFGSPRPLEGDRSSLGTHGQLYLVVFSHGFPGLALFVSWFAYTFWRLQRSPSLIVFWTSLSLLVALVQMPFYNQLPNQILVMMAAAALAWRERIWLEDDPVSAAPSVAPSATGGREPLGAGSR